MKKSKAVIVVKNPEALRVAASSARISTQQGTSLEIFQRSQGGEKDLNLIDKVLSSGHKSVIEHQTFSVAFNDVSVLVEQFVIEARLNSYTVKSRRYVDFAGAGFVVPEGLDAAQEKLYRDAMAARFADYEKLLALGVPKEDARFVLPYCLRSNFYMTLNARSLIGLILAMIAGRGKGFAEVEALGAQLKKQFDAIYPGVIAKELKRYPGSAPVSLPTEIEAPCVGVGGASLLSATPSAGTLLEAAMGFSGRFEPEMGMLMTQKNMRRLLLDARPRELELLNYVFGVQRISLACLTHFVRHRVDSPIVPPVLAALAGGSHVLPQTVAAIPEAEKVYNAAFEAQADAAQRALDMGVAPAIASYFAMSGHQIDILLGMNARELLHFMKLRTCSRAQWEIQGVAGEMLLRLQEEMPALFGLYGPSCRFGPCPEGRMSCGKPRERI